MLCHLGISEYLEGGRSTRLLTKCSEKPAVKLSGGRCWLLAYPLAPERCSWFNAYRELCLLAQRLLLLSWQPERKTKPARMDWPVWLKDLFTHTSVHTCMPHHTHIGTDRQAHTSTLRHMQIDLRSTQMPRDHIPINLQSPWFQQVWLPTREPCQYSSMILVLGRRDLG